MVATIEPGSANDIIVERNVMVPMRDGVQLATDVYRPAPTAAGQSPRLPVILERTPYDKRGISRSDITASNPVPASRPQIAEFFARQGFVAVVQDCRGRYQSQGRFRKYLNEAEDGYDTLAWLLEQAWCNGTVGTMGLSYGAHVQCALACLDPPGLACMFMDSGGFSSAYHGGIRRGGAFELKQATWAYRHALRSPDTLADPQRQASLEESDIRAWFRDMPWQRGHSPLSAAPEFEDYLFEQWQAGTFSDYWMQPGLYAEGYYDRFPDVPTAIMGSWYDPYVLTCLTNFTELSQRHASPMRLIMGPWTHGDRSQTWAGDVDFGSSSTLDGAIASDYLQLRLQWFARHLQDGQQSDGHQSGSEPVVSYFRMGGGDGSVDSAGRLQHGGEWRHTPQWPPAGTTSLPLYLQTDGTLAARASDDADFLEYRYDPHDPVPTIGGALTSGEPVMRGGAFDQRETSQVFKYRGEPTGRPLAERDDVLVFQTAPLQQALTVSGAIVIELQVSSDCPDTDFTAKLIDVYPPGTDGSDGQAINITDGIFRMRYRKGWDRETRMKAGKVYAVRIEPFATSNLFQVGHRLRIDISSSNYPHFDINPNTGAAGGYPSEARVATNRVYLGGKHASRVLLPVESPAGEAP
ncbi:MAG: CocE/NonD family hydrolase [Woeseia sp.]